ncbi:MAG TPA: YutD family protein [Acholeplasmataceae bacterium]|nr:YutD family protein [Acholeplasmataceae bacterium]
MIIETEVGTFELLKNHRDAFDIIKFQERYVDVAFDRYTYLVGDMASDILRIKGFSQDPKSPNGYKKIPDYINESCNHNCPFYVLKRVKSKDVKV